jgi:hypothetical protein
MQSVTYRYTDADLVDARSYAYNSLPLVRVIRFVPRGMVVASLVLGAWLVLGLGWDAPAALSALWGWLVIGVLLVVWTFLADRWVLPSSVRKSLARDKGLQGENTVGWDAEKLTLRGSHGQSLWPWGDFARWQESPGGLLLWQGDRVYNYLPKRSLTDGQAEEIRGYLTAAIGKVGQKRK